MRKKYKECIGKLQKKLVVIGPLFIALEEKITLYANRKKNIIIILEPIFSMF